MPFKKYSDKTCTSEAADAKLVKYKDLADFGTDIKFKECDAYGKTGSFGINVATPKVKKATPAKKPNSPPAKKPDTVDKKDAAAKKKQDDAKKKAKAEKDKKVKKAGGTPAPAKDYCKLKFTEYGDKECKTVTKDKKELAKMKKMSKAWKEGAAKFRNCKKLEGKT
jgi:hypothetical protein